MATEIAGSITVISDVGPTANSYVSIEDTKAFWALDPYKMGTTLSDEEIGRALISATKQLNTQYGSKYLGTFFDDTYALFFPRTGIADSRGVPIDDYGIFPVEVGEATSVQAWYTANTNRNAETTASGVKQNKMDGLGSQTFFSPAQQKSIAPTLISDETTGYIAPYITISSKYVELLGRG